jgi:hypothetical protein
MSHRLNTAKCSIIRFLLSFILVCVFLAFSDSNKSWQCKRPNAIHAERCSMERYPSTAMAARRITAAHANFRLKAQAAEASAQTAILNFRLQTSKARCCQIKLLYLSALLSV